MDGYININNHNISYWGINIRSNRDVFLFTRLVLPSFDYITSVVIINERETVNTQNRYIAVAVFLFIFRLKTYDYYIRFGN